ncbi:hypothetical protein ABZ348_18575 [Streptomyces sp. NPDC005963]
MAFNVGVVPRWRRIAPLLLPPPDHKGGKQPHHGTEQVFDQDEPHDRS